MANSNTRMVLVACIIFASFALAHSEATCPLNLILRMESCSSLVDWFLNDASGDPPKAKWQCCNALNGLDGQVAADCLCILINGNVFGKNDSNVDSTLGSVFNVCRKDEPASYQCLV